MRECHFKESTCTIYLKKKATCTIYLKNLIFLYPNVQPAYFAVVLVVVNYDGAKTLMFWIKFIRSRFRGKSNTTSSFEPYVITTSKI